MLPVLVITVLAFLTGLTLTWYVRGWALRVGLVDAPDDHRKTHSKVTPLGGGLAIFSSTVFALVALCVFSPEWRTDFHSNQTFITGLVLSALMILLVGLMDDYWGMRGRQKLFAQFAVSFVMATFGTLISRVQLFDMTVDLGPLAYPFTMCWLIGAMNAINLLDGIDGLAASIGVIACASLAALASLGGNPSIAAIAIVFAMSLLGFLRFNVPPATIFLGDTGSLLIGLVIGTLSIGASQKGVGTLFLLAPLAILSVPFFDSSAAILRRTLTGRSLYTTDRGHIHHLLTKKLGHRKALAMIIVACVFTSFAAVLGAWIGSDLIIFICIGMLLAASVFTRSFGHSEAKLLAKRSWNFISSLLVFNIPDRDKANVHDVVHLQGNRQWEVIWESLVEGARNSCVQELKLDVNLPILHEEYLATWKRDTRLRSDNLCEIRYPLYSKDRAIGFLYVTILRTKATASQNFAELNEVLIPFEKELEDFVEGHLSDPNRSSIDPANPVPAPHVSPSKLKSLPDN